MMNQATRARGIFLLVGLLACGASATVRGQPGEARLRLEPPRLRLHSGRPAGKEVADGKLRLRPNETRAAFLVLENPATDSQVVRVELVQAGKDVPDTVFARADVTVEGAAGPNKGKAPVTGWKVEAPPAPPAAPAAAGAAPPPPPVAAGLDLEAPDNVVEVRAYVLTREGKDGKEERLTPLPGSPLPVSVAFLRPDEYIETPSVEFTKDKLLTVRVRPNDQFQGTDCKVELVIRPGDIRDLALPLETAALQGVITARTRQCELYAELLTRDGGAPARGRFALTVDGWDRAFTYDAAFAAEAAPRPLTEEELRVDVAPYSARGDKLHLRVQTANITSWDRATLTVGLYRRGSELPAVAADRVGAREARVRLKATPDGTLAFTGLVRDWEIDLDTRPLVGIFDLRTTLKYGDAPPLTDSRPVVLDTTPPERVQIVEPLEGGKALRGQPLAVQAVGRDPQSQIGRVVFFFGKLPDDRKVPADAVVGVRRGEDGPWAATLLVPADAPKKPLPVTVQFTNRAGLSEVATITVVPADPEVKDNKKPASIAGQVVQGGDPKLGKLTVDEKALRPQGGVKVQLLSGRTVVATKDTDENGKYKFENVTPGVYTVYCMQGATNRSASAVVDVKEFEQKTGIDLRLKR